MGILEFWFEGVGFCCGGVECLGFEEEGSWVGFLNKDESLPLGEACEVEIAAEEEEAQRAEVLRTI